MCQGTVVVCKECANVLEEVRVGNEECMLEIASNTAKEKIWLTPEERQTWRLSQKPSSHTYRIHHFMN